jgi:hypothetical protein
MKATIIDITGTDTTLTTAPTSITTATKAITGSTIHPNDRHNRCDYSYSYNFYNNLGSVA